MRIQRLCEFAGDDVQVSLVHVLEVVRISVETHRFPAGSIAQDNNPDEFLSPPSGRAK